VPACEALDFSPLRADQIAGPERIPVITQHLSSAPLAVAYMGNASSNWNGDVMLEIGYRLSTGLPLVMISECPESLADGRLPSFKELLPFHLLNKTIVTVPSAPQEGVDRLVEEIKTALDEKPRDNWNTIHPIIEIKFSNLKEDLTLTYVSPDAKALFGLNESIVPDLEAMRRKFKERMSDVQYDAYYDERLQILRRIQDEGMGLGDPEKPCRIPSPRVPIIFKEQLHALHDKPVGYLPLIIRYSMSRGTIQLRILYVEVSTSLRHDPSGCWVCEL